jgi:2-phospho-L-lactate transferase/gluconeogenesis factor (CofD/UPF0052 family)
MTQPGETDGFSLEKHIEVLLQYAPRIRFDNVVINNMPIWEEQRKKYAEEGAEQIDVDNIAKLSTTYGVRLVCANLLSEGEMVRHDPERLAAAVLSCSVAAAGVS